MAKREIIDVKHITATNPWDFLNEVQVLFLDGYELSEDNEHYPVNFGYHLSVGLVKYAPEVPPKEMSEEKKAALEEFADQVGAAIPTGAKKRGRPSK